ncbi:amidohydrolase family protein [Sphingomonas sp.]|uniref:amidohydrolase family protein n=1 Tax=Sphingomonas sp. TaxID=28214 RepID=UPI002DD61EEA|nr:amidohydrolase family protein [Sphingomonas sp.]
MRQLRVGRDEPILDPGMPIIDAHHHLFDRPNLRYMLDDYLADTQAGHRIVASVYVETLAFAWPDGPEVMRPIGEVEFANGAGAIADSGRYGDARLCAAIVGYADMRHGDAIAGLLDRCAETAPDRFRGVRQITMEYADERPYPHFPKRPPNGVMEHPEFRRAFAHLAPRGLIFDAAVFDPQLRKIADLADAFPDTTITLNHMGVAMGVGMSPAERGELFQRWRAALGDLARRRNVHCKVGGLGMPFWGLGLDTRDDPIGFAELAEVWRPYVETAIEAFGTDRCMFESNYPVDGRSAGYVPLWNAFKHIASGLSADEKADLFHRTAARVHGIDLATLGIDAATQPAS